MQAFGNNIEKSKRRKFYAIGIINKWEFIGIINKVTAVVSR